MLTFCCLAHCRLEREGQLEAAVKCYREALADDPHQETARERLRIITTALEKQVGAPLCTVAVIPTVMLKFIMPPSTVLLSSNVLPLLSCIIIFWWQISHTGCLGRGHLLLTQISVPGWIHCTPL